MKNRYKCTHVGKKGNILDRFFRVARDKQEIIEFLDTFEWQGRGDWEIELVEEDVEGY